MIAFRMNWGGAAIVTAIVLIGLEAMTGQLAAGLLLGGLTVLSLVLHECGHILTARALGVKVREIGISLKGTYIRREQAREPSEEVAIALSGPMVNALIAAVLWSAPGVGHWLAINNLVLTLSNLAPLAGSDGRRACNAWARTLAVRVPISAQKKKDFFH